MISNMTSSIYREVIPCPGRLKASADCCRLSSRPRDLRITRYLRGSRVAACRIWSARPLEMDFH